MTDGRASGPYDQARAEKAVRELLLALGEDPDREGLKETPARVARAMKENFEGLDARRCPGRLVHQGVRQ